MNLTDHLLATMAILATCFSLGLAARMIWDHARLSAGKETI